jgi:hypothetical protein
MVASVTAFSPILRAVAIIMSPRICSASCATLVRRLLLPAAAGKQLDLSSCFESGLSRPARRWFKFLAPLRPCQSYKLLSLYPVASRAELRPHGATHVAPHNPPLAHPVLWGLPLRRGLAVPVLGCGEGSFRTSVSPHFLHFPAAYCRRSDLC